MRLTLKNLVGSPYDIQTMNGPAILPAFGEFTGDFSEHDAEMYLMSGALTVSEPEPEEPADAELEPAPKKKRKDR